MASWAGDHAGEWANDNSQSNLPRNDQNGQSWTSASYINTPIYSQMRHNQYFDQDKSQSSLGQRVWEMRDKVNDA